MATEKLGPCMQCVRFLLFGFNALFWLMGLSVLAVGIWARIQFSDYMKLSSHDYATAAYILIGVGFLIAIIGFLGCCGALKEHTCLLKTFGVILGLLFLVELGTAITGYIFRNEIKTGLSEGLNTALKDYPQPGFKEAWNDMQKNLQCCGSKNYTDWFTAPISPGKTWNSSVPESCCVSKVSKCNVDVNRHPNTIYSKQGCYDAAVKFFEDKLIIIGSVSLGVAAFQLIGITLACCLASTLHNNLKYELV